MLKINPEILDSFPRVSIAVLGDFMLDEFLMGEISRVSREAPVLILKYVDSQFCPGGAANTVANTASLGAGVFPIGMVGNDEWGAKLISLWPANVSREGIIQEPGVKTTKKTRILGGAFHSTRQQVVRMDYENPLDLTAAREKQLIERLRTILPRVDALIISDYSLGNLSRAVRETAIEMGRSRGIPVVVDSRDNSACYPGATAVTPNISEVEESLGIEIGSSLGRIRKSCSPLPAKWQIDTLLVTMGKLGLSLVEESRFTHIPAWGKEAAVDVSGAGDTVVSAFTCALASGADSLKAAILANVAGGLVVMKKGTAVVSRQEIKATLEE